MLNWRKILFPTDFSDAARPALTVAAELARRFDAELTLLHVYQVPGWGLPEGVVIAGPETVARLLDAIDTELQRWAKEAQLEGAVRARTDTAMGVAQTEIIRVAREQRFDVIVIGTHGRSGFEHALLGSVAEKVVRKADCPVITVRQKQQPKKAG